MKNPRPPRPFSVSGPQPPSISSPTWTNSPPSALAACQGWVAPGTLLTQRPRKLRSGPNWGPSFRVHPQKSSRCVSLQLPFPAAFSAFSSCIAFASSCHACRSEQAPVACSASFAPLPNALSSAARARLAKTCTTEWCSFFDSSTKYLSLTKFMTSLSPTE